MQNNSIKVNNFITSGITTDDEIREFIYKLFPSEHLEWISEIKYVDKYYSLVTNSSLDRLLATGINVTSQWVRDEDSKQEFIELFRQDIDRSTNLSRLKSDIAHEIGHSVYYHLKEDRKNTYYLIWQSGRNRSQNIRAANDVIEDFCYCYATFFLERDKLYGVQPEKFEFMANIS